MVVLLLSNPRITRGWVGLTYLFVYTFSGLKGWHLENYFDPYRKLVFLSKRLFIIDLLLWLGRHFCCFTEEQKIKKKRFTAAIRAGLCDNFVASRQATTPQHMLKCDKKSKWSLCTTIFGGHVTGDTFVSLNQKGDRLSQQMTRMPSSGNHTRLSDFFWTHGHRYFLMV